MEKPEPFAESLYRAIKSDRLDFVEALIPENVVSDIEFFQYCGETPVGLAIREGRERLLPILLAKADKYFALDAAVRLNQVPVIQYLRSKCPYPQRFLGFLGL
jgi:hypothetical protein